MPKPTRQSAEESRSLVTKVVSANKRLNTHPIGRGETATVIRFGERTTAFIEGSAVVKNATGQPHCYDVQFVGERTVRRRMVYREFQHEPERLLAMLLNIWRAENAAAADFSAFFPDDDLQTRG